MIADGEPGTGAITFTSNQGTPTAGYWRNIYFERYSSGSLLDNVIVEYGGYDEQANIYCYYSSPTITNSIIRNSSGRGIWCENTNPTVQNCTFSNNASYPIRIGARFVPGLTGNTFEGNDFNDGIEVLGETISSSGTWTKQGTHYTIVSNVFVQGNPAPTLTIEPGVTVKFNQNVGLFVGDNYYSNQAGRLIADGEPGTGAITFTSKQGTPTAGYWRNIYFERYSSGSLLDNVIVEYGGYDEQANIYCYYSSPMITNSIIRNSSGHGIRLSSLASPQMTNCIFTNNGNRGIYCDDSQPSPTITNCTFSNNGFYPVCIGANAVAKVTGNTFVGSDAGRGIEVVGDTVSSSGAWTNQGVPYRITGNVSVQGTPIPTLTIEPGVTVKFNQNVGLFVGDNYYSNQSGRLIADGEPGTGAITFTSNQGTPTAGYWRNIYFERYSSGSLLDNVIVEYGGYDEQANIYCYYSSPTITNSIIRNSSNYGISLYQSFPSIQNSTIIKNKYGVYCTSNSNPTINYCDIVSNSPYGVYNAGTNIINAENNWWGSPSGPGGVGTGTGDSVSNYVDYIPWLGSSVNDSVPPLPVDDLAVAGIGDNWVRLNWAVPEEAEWYDLRYATWTINEANWGSATQAGIITVSETLQVFTVTNLAQNVTYYFRLKSADAVRNWSGLSNEVNATTFLPPPSNLTAGIVWEDEVRLRWQDNSNLETGFSIERKVGNGVYAEIGTVAENITTYRDTNVATNTFYWYRVRAYNALGYSNYSNTAMANISPWLYQTEVFINNLTNPATLTDYQVVLTLTPAIFDYSRLRIDGADLRFRDGSMTLSYWIETWDIEATSTIWIKIPQIPGSSTKIIMMHYGNFLVSPMSDGEGTFDFFDDFNDYSGWSGNVEEFNITTLDEENVLYVKSDATGYPGWIYKPLPSLTSYLVEIKMRNEQDTNEPHPGVIIAGTDGNNWHGVYFRANYNEVVGAVRYSWGSPVTSHNIAGAIWYDIEAIVTDGLMRHLYIDGVEKIAFTNWDIEDNLSIAGIIHFGGSDGPGYFDKLRVRKYTDPEPVANLGSILVGIEPDTGVNSDGTISATITATGSGFKEGVEAKLSRQGQSDIIGTNTIVVSNQILTTTFDLTDKPIGDWDVVVTNPNELPLILRYGFYIRDVVFPVPEIIQPADGAIICGSNVRFEARQINGQDGVKTVWEILDGGNWKSMGISTNPQNNFAITWNSHQISDGNHTVRARLFDVGENVGTDTIEVMVDNTAPAPQITLPADGAVVSGENIQFTAIQTNGSDAILTTYEIWNGSYWQMIGTSSDSPNFAITWDSRQVTDGSHSIRAVMKDYIGNSSLSPIIIIGVDNTAPIPQIIEPVTPISCHSVKFKARQTNGNDAIKTRWEIFVNDSWIPMGSSTDVLSDFMIIWDSHTVADGTYTVRAIMEDRGGKTDSTTLVVNVDNTPPASFITSPVPAALLNRLTQISGTASDKPSSGISKVEVSIKRDSDNNYWVPWQWVSDERWLVANGQQSWSYNWTPDGDGSYTVRSRATDGVGNTETPKPGITFTYDATPPPVNIIYPLAGSLFNTHTLSVKIMTEPELVVRMTDPQTGQQISKQADSQGSVTFSGLVFNEGANNIAASATDTAGNTGQGNVNFVIDTTPPYTCCYLPAKGAIDVLPWTNIILHLKDDGAGINQTSMVMKVEGGTVTPAISGNKYDYTLNYNPAADFVVGQVVDVEVYAEDMAFVPRAIYEGYSFTIINDSTPPDTTIMPLSPDPTDDTTPTFSGQAIDTITNVIDIEYRLNGGEWVDVNPFTPARIVNYSFTTPLLNHGTYTVEVRARDEVGNTETTYAKDTFEIDTVSPGTPTITSPTEGAVIGVPSVTVRGRGEGNTIVFVYATNVLKGTGFVAPDGNWQVPINLADGTHSLTAVIKDKVGHLSPPSLSVEITIDASAPVVNITTPSQGDIFNTSTVEVKGTTEPNLTVTITDPQTNQQISRQADNQGNFAFIGLVFKEGTNIATVRAIDSVGNIGQGQVTFSIDTQLPYTCCHLPAKGAVGIPRETNITLHIKDDGAGVNHASMVIKVNGETVTATISGNKNDYTVNYNPAIDFNFGDVVQVEVYAEDLNTTPGNVSESYSFTIGIDNSSPDSSIVPLTPDPTSNTTPTWTGAAQDTLSNVAKVEYRVDEGFWQDVDPFTPARRVNYSFTIAPPLLQGSHKVEVRAIDEFGNTETTYAVDTFVIDTTFPAAPTGAKILFYPQEYGTTANMHLIWNANQEQDIAGYNIYRSSSEPQKMNTAPVTDTVYEDKGLEIGKEYTYQVTAVDRTGNEGSKSEGVKFIPTSLYGQALEIFGESFIKGVGGKVRVKFTNYGLGVLNVYTSKNMQPVDDLMVYVKTFEGNILAEGKIYQYDSDTIRYPDYSYARIVPNSSFMFATITVTLPLDTPDNVMVEAIIKKSHYEERATINGPVAKASIIVPVGLPAYQATAVTDKDVYDQNEVVTISGLVTDSEDNTPVSYAVVKIGIKVRGIARYRKVTADVNGNYTFKFIPIPGEAGKYSVWAVHPDVIVEECDDTFIILGMAIVPVRSGLVMSKNATESLTFAVKNTGETPLSAVTLNIIDNVPTDSVSGQVLTPPVNLQPGEEGKFEVRITAGIDATSLALLDLSATTGEGITRYGSLTVQLKEALPLAQLSPYQITRGMKSGDERIESVSVSNEGYDTLRNVTVSSPTLPWVSIITDNILGDIPPRGTKSFNIKIQPPGTISTGQYQDKIDITSSNYQTLSVYLNILITTSQVGDVLFVIMDILDKPVGTVSISANSQELKTVSFSGQTDAEGKVLIKDIPAGRYTYWLSAEGYDRTGGNLVVEAGMTNTVAATITQVIMGVEWTVTPTTIEDEYDVVVKATFETKVPAPRITITPPALSFVIQPGQSADAELTIHNFGFISVFNFEIKPISVPPLIIEALTPLIPEIKAMSTVTVPIKVTVLTHASPFTPSCKPFSTSITYYAEKYICYNEDGSVKWEHTFNIPSTPVTVRTSDANLGLSNYVFHRTRYINCPELGQRTPDMVLTVCNKDTEQVQFCDCRRLRITVTGIVPFMKDILDAISLQEDMADDWQNMSLEEFAEKYALDPEELRRLVKTGVNVGAIFNKTLGTTKRIHNVLERAIQSSVECPDLPTLDNLIEILKESALQLGQEIANKMMKKIIGIKSQISQFEDDFIPPGQCSTVKISGNTSQFFGAGGAEFCVKKGNGECCCYSITITDSTWICSETVNSIIGAIYNWITSGGGPGGGGGGCWWCPGGGGVYRGNSECPGGMQRVPVN